LDVDEWTEVDRGGGKIVRMAVVNVLGPLGKSRPRRGRGRRHYHTGTDVYKDEGKENEEKREKRVIGRVFFEAGGDDLHVLVLAPMTNKPPLTRP
jgi:hypothetical protein